MLTNCIPAALCAALCFSGFAHAHVELTSPLGGQEFRSGEQVQVEWFIQVEHNTDNFDLLYSTTGDNGPFLPIQMDIVVNDFSSGTSHSFTWTVPDTPSSTVRVRVIQDNSGLDYVSTSPNDLAICRAPVNYCDLTPNSAGAGARIAFSGSLIIQNDGFSITASDAVPNAVGLFYFGGEATQQPFGDGNRCVAPGALGVLRLNPPAAADGTGSAERALDFGTAPGSVIAPGDTVFFQYWQRDPSGPGGSGFNLSDGLEVSFCP